MYLHEYQSKQYLAKFGIPTPAGKIAATHDEAAGIAAEFGVPVIVNAQALASRRVFRLAKTPQEAEHIARDILAMTIEGVRVHTILIEPAADIIAQYFLGIYADRGSSLLMIASGAGGMDISEIERASAQTISRETINPFLGVLDFQARNLASGINLPRETWGAFTRIAQNLHRCCLACDAVRGEINPLGLTRTGELVALGGKLVIDDNALFRQPEIAASRDVEAETASAVAARSAGITYVRLNGTIGCVVSGAGLGMATMDALARYSREASGLIDLGSDLRRDKISAALRLITPTSDAVLFNIFTDKASCAEVAQEFVAASETMPAVPIVIRLAGWDTEQGLNVLSQAQSPRFVHVDNMNNAVRLVVAAAKGYADVRLH